MFFAVTGAVEDRQESSEEETCMPGSLLRGSCALQKVSGIFHCVSLNTADAEMAKDDEHVFSATASEDVRLGDLGYEQGRFEIKSLSCSF